MHRKTKTVLANLSLSVISILLFLLFLEFVVFRFFLIATDYPTPDFVNGVVRYQAGQEGIYRVKNEIEAEFHINSNGWNSGHGEYTITKDSGKFRIAVVGDSYINALQIGFDESLAEQLESKLGDRRFQVYRFGIDGAPLSQYLHMLRHEVLQYSPDLLIINLVHNDFDESYQFKPGVYTSSFMKLKIDNGKVSEELDPIPYEPPWYDWIRKSATWRYFAYRQQVRFGALRRIILGENPDQKRFLANIDASLIEKNEEDNRIITDYVFREMKSICDAKNIELLILIDGDREGIYENLEPDLPQDRDILSINRMAADVAAKYGIDFVDLQGVFRDDYEINKNPFNFVNDGHWNSYAHGLVADTTADYIKTRILSRFEETR